MVKTKIILEDKNKLNLVLNLILECKNIPKKEKVSLIKYVHSSSIPANLVERRQLNRVKSRIDKIGNIYKLLEEMRFM